MMEEDKDRGGSSFEIEPVRRDHCWCWLNAERACCNCGDDGDGGALTSACQSSADACRHAPNGSVGYMLQVYLRQGWVDAFARPVEDYSEVLPLRGMGAHTRLVRRTTTDEVLP